MKKYIIGLIGGFILVSVITYAADILIPATSISYSSEYTEKDNVADALDELLNNEKFKIFATFNVKTDIDDLSGKNVSAKLLNTDYEVQANFSSEKIDDYYIATLNVQSIGEYKISSEDYKSYDKVLDFESYDVKLKQYLYDSKDPSTWDDWIANDWIYQNQWKSSLHATTPSITRESDGSTTVYNLQVNNEREDSGTYYYKNELTNMSGKSLKCHVISASAANKRNQFGNYMHLNLIDKLEDGYNVISSQQIINATSSTDVNETDFIVSIDNINRLTTFIAFNYVVQSTTNSYAKFMFDSVWIE